MAEEETEGVVEEKHGHRKVVFGGEAVAVLSLLLLVPAVRRMREHRQQKHRRHFIVFGH
jgi:hypothetical protein